MMKYTCKKLEPPKDDPHARWAVGVYDKTTGRVDFKYADEFDMYADPLQAKPEETGSALPEGDWLDKKIAIADAFQTPKAQRQLRQRAANRVAPEATFGGADLSSTVKELEEKASQQQAEEEKSGLEVVSTTFDNAFAAHSASLDAQKRALSSGFRTRPGLVGARGVARLHRFSVKRCGRSSNARFTVGAAFAGVPVAGPEGHV